MFQTMGMTFGLIARGTPCHEGYDRGIAENLGDARFCYRHHGEEAYSWRRWATHALALMFMEADGKRYASLTKDEYREYIARAYALVFGD